MEKQMEQKVENGLETEGEIVVHSVSSQHFSRIPKSHSA